MWAAVCIEHTDQSIGQPIDAQLVRDVLLSNLGDGTSVRVDMPSKHLESPHSSDAAEAHAAGAESGIPLGLSTLAPASQVVARALPQGLWASLIERLPYALLLIGEDDRVLVA